MGQCSKCGEKSMDFTCRYCGEKFCSEHRLPENHDCEGLEESQKESSEEHEEWFEEKFSDKKEKKETVEGKPAVYKTHRQSLTKDLLKTLTGSLTLLIIGLTTVSYIFQLSVTGYQELLILDTNIDELLLRPWSLLTVALLHGPPFHIFANMLTFYFFATPLERMVGGLKMLKIYIISALAGSIAMVGFHNLMRFLHGDASMAGLVVGASAGVIGIVGVIAKLYPDADVLLFFIIPMKIKTAVYGFAAFEAVNIVLTITGLQIWIFPIEFFASAGHIAGLITGLYFGKKLQDKYKRNKGVFNPLEV